MPVIWYNVFMRKDKNITWSTNSAYAIGLFVADGSLSKDGRHLDFTSKDLDQVENFLSCIGSDNLISTKSRSRINEGKNYFHAQFSDVTLYRFLNNIGIQNNKSLTIAKVDVPDKYFADFLRGLLDGDGCISLNNHIESKIPQIKTRFTSGSNEFLLWLKKKIAHITDVSGGCITKSTRCWQLSYGKGDSLVLISFMYYSADLICLRRKFDTAQHVLDLQN